MTDEYPKLKFPQQIIFPLKVMNLEELQGNSIKIYLQIFYETIYSETIG